MVTPELITFIKQQISNGVSVDLIKQSLQSNNWSMDDINTAFAQLQLSVNSNQPTITTPVNNDQKKPKKKIPWFITVGLIVPPVMFVFIFIMFVIQTKGFKTGTFSVTINGASNPTLVQVQSLLKDTYPKANINLTWNNAKNLQSGISENTLLVTIAMGNKLNAEDRKTVAVQICNIYSNNNQQLDKLVIWSSLPRLFSIFPAESLEKQSVEERNCFDWISKPAKI